ncbi:MAG: TlpA family protein disulfide reductase [Flavobacteriaceae bacterium]|nr:TlpA family protein disulfide reductase [Flavobacteriaceae bacterium]
MKSLFYSFIFFFAFQFSGAQSFQEGSKALNFKLYALDGTISNLETYKDKVIVIKMWFKECTPCLQEIPTVNKLVEKYENRNDIVFIAPSPNSKSTLEKFVEKVNFKYIVMSSSYEMLRDYNPLRRYPTHAIIDKKGVVSFLYEGTSQNIGKILSSEIDKALEI